MFLTGQTAGALSGIGYSLYSYFAYIIPTMLSWSISVYINNQSSDMFLLSFFILMYMAILLKSSLNQQKITSKLWRIEETLKNNFQIYMYKDVIKGLSHEINNGLCKISLASARLSENEEKNSNIIDNAVLKIQDVLESIKNNKTNEAIKKDISIKEFTDKFYEVFSDNRISLFIDPKVNFINSNKMILISSLENIIQNSKESINEDGNISVKIYSNNAKVTIEISDSGSPINEKDVSKVFNPFFTTKDISSNKGIGLALTKQFLHSVNADVELADDAKTFIIRV